MWGAQVGERGSALLERRAQVIAISATVSSLYQVNKALVPSWNLHAFEAEVGGPFRYAVQRVKRSLVRRKLSEKYRGASEGGQSRIAERRWLREGYREGCRRTQTELPRRFSVWRIRVHRKVADTRPDFCRSLVFTDSWR